MDRYFTIMLIPEREKGIRSIRVPKIVLRAITFLIVISIILISILSYDYWKILHQVYVNKHLTTENRLLKEQIQLFQNKINSLNVDIERIYTFEKKLRIITGLEKIDLSKNSDDVIKSTSDEDINSKKNRFFSLNNPSQISEQKQFLDLKNLYEQKMATQFGLQTSYSYTKEWTELTKQSFTLASKFATFDYKFDIINDFVKNLEVNIHELDQYLLDKDSFIKSTPTLLPTKGWITSYFGERNSPYSGRKKMHEGLDIGAKTGTAVTSPADGIVTYTGSKPGFGKVIQVDNGYGVETIFAHNASIDVKKGDPIRRGTIIARVGNTGRSTGPHVHYEIRVNGVPIDPLYYILD